MPASFKFFLADDDEDDRYLFEQALKEVGSNSSLFTAENGEKLMQLLNYSEVLPDIIMIDVNMPRKNGLASLKEIRSLHRFNSTPVVIFSTSVEKYHVEYAISTGANHYIRKPSTYEGLKKVAALCIGICSKQDEEKFLIQVS